MGALKVLSFLYHGLLIVSVTALKYLYTTTSILTQSSTACYCYMYHSFYVSWFTVVSAALIYFVWLLLFLLCSLRNIPVMIIISQYHTRILLFLLPNSQFLPSKTYIISAACTYFMLFLSFCSVLDYIYIYHCCYMIIYFINNHLLPLY